MDETTWMDENRVIGILHIHSEIIITLPYIEYKEIITWKVLLIILKLFHPPIAQ